MKRENKSRNYKIAVIGGDGTGPEVVREALKVLAASSKKNGYKLDLTHFDYGGERYLKTGKVLTAMVRGHEASFVKVGQRVRAFPPESKSSMFQAWVTKVTPREGGVALEVTLSSTGHPNSSNYVIEVVTVRGEFLSIPNEAIIEEGTRHVVYVQRQGGQYVPVEIKTGIQGELYTAVESGLKEGDQVVSFGSFFVDSEYKLKFAGTESSNDQQHH